MAESSGSNGTQIKSQDLKVTERGLVELQNQRMDVATKAVAAGNQRSH